MCRCSKHGHYRIIEGFGTDDPWQAVCSTGFSFVYFPFFRARPNDLVIFVLIFRKKKHCLKLPAVKNKGVFYVFVPRHTQRNLNGKKVEILTVFPPQNGGEFTNRKLLGKPFGTVSVQGKRRHQTDGCFVLSTFRVFLSRSRNSLLGPSVYKNITTRRNAHVVPQLVHQLI